MFLYPVDPGAIRTRIHATTIRTRLYGRLYEGAISHRGANWNRMSHLTLMQLIQDSYTRKSDKRRLKTGKATKSKMTQWEEKISKSNLDRSAIGFTVIKSDKPPHVFNFTSSSLNSKSFKQLGQADAVGNIRLPPADWAQEIAQVVNGINIQDVEPVEHPHYIPEAPKVEAAPAEIVPVIKDKKLTFGDFQLTAQQVADITDLDTVAPTLTTILTKAKSDLTQHLSNPEMQGIFTTSLATFISESSKHLKSSIALSIRIFEVVDTLFSAT